jgi:hypothetical protein
MLVENDHEYDESPSSNLLLLMMSIETSMDLGVVDDVDDNSDEDEDDINNEDITGDLVNDRNSLNQMVAGAKAKAESKDDLASDDDDDQVPSAGVDDADFDDEEDDGPKRYMGTAHEIAVLHPSTRCYRCCRLRQCHDIMI